MLGGSVPTCTTTAPRRIDVRPLITAQIPLQRAHEAFELALDRTKSTKVQLVAPD